MALESRGWSLSKDLLLRLIRPADHITRDKCRYLEEHDYVVGPKADGQRMLLFCQPNTKELYLVSPTVLSIRELVSFGNK